MSLGAVRGTSAFVGREAELEALLALVRGARNGSGGVAVLVGEPGIGKTRTAAAFAERASRDAVILWGTARESDWSPPFAPWIEAAAPYVRSLSPEVLTQRLGELSAALADTLPAARELLPTLPRSPALATDEARYRALEAFARLLLAEERPLVIVLDDLHWADPASLELVRFLAPSLPDSRLVIVGTHREGGVPDALPQALAELDRHVELRRLHIGSLTLDEARDLIEGVYGRDVGSETAEAILAETGGNPFFIGEVTRHLRETGVAPGEIGVPDSVRAAVGRRIARLSPTTARLLSVAAAFTGPFSFAELQALTNLEEHELLETIDEALGAAMIRPAGEEEYEFAHALVRHSLYGALSPSRQARLHRRIAQALERVHVGRETEHAAELATQYARSASLPGAAHGIRHALNAADQAQTAHAHVESVGYLEIARGLAAEADDTVRAEILCRLAIAQAGAALLVDAAETTAEALAALDAADADANAVGEFLASVTWVMKDVGATTEMLAPLVDRGLEVRADRKDLTWARLKLVLSPVERLTAGPLRYGAMVGFDPNAVAVARASGDEEDYARSLEWPEGRDLTDVDELLRRIRGWRNSRAAIYGLSIVVRSYLYGFEALDEAAAAARALLDTSDRSGSVVGRGLALNLLAEVETMRGEFDSARRHLEEASEPIRRLGPVHKLRATASNADEYLLVYAGGESLEVAEEYRRLAMDPSFPWSWNGVYAACFAAMLYAYEGARVEAEELLALVTPVLPDRGGQRSYGGEVFCAAAAVWELGSTELADSYAELAHSVLETRPGRSSAHVALGRMTALAGEVEGALSRFEEARAGLEASGQRPLRAIVDYDEGLALIRADRRRDAAAMLARARPQFEELGMAPWIERTKVLARRTGRSRGPAGLTAREIEVLRLLAAGRTNREIAGDLVVSVNTVERHLGNLYRKIGARNRAEASAFAAREQL